MTGAPLRVRERAGESRCPFCHGGLSGETVTCGVCRTTLHAECQRAHGGCTTLGCSGVATAPDRTPAVLPASAAAVEDASFPVRAIPRARFAAVPPILLARWESERPTEAARWRLAAAIVLGTIPLSLAGVASSTVLVLIARHWGGFADATSGGEDGPLLALSIVLALGLLAFAAIQNALALPGRLAAARAILEAHRWRASLLNVATPDDGSPLQATFEGPEGPVSIPAPADLRRPGDVVPVRVHWNGPPLPFVLERADGALVLVEKTNE